LHAEESLQWTGGGVEEEDQRWPLWVATALLGMSTGGAWLSEDVTMMAVSDWDYESAGRVLTGQGETRPHLGEDSLAGCETLRNKVSAGVTSLPRGSPVNCHHSRAPF
jgi:hypothetical protein